MYLSNEAIVAIVTLLVMCLPRAHIFLKKLWQRKRHGFHNGGRHFQDVLANPEADKISEAHRPILPLHHDSSPGVYYAYRAESRLEERVMFYPAHQLGGSGKSRFHATVSGRTDE